MTALSQNVEQVKAQIRAQADRQTVTGPEASIGLSLSPRAFLLLASPLAVALTMLLGWVLLQALNRPLHAGEMGAAAVINVVGGTFAALPLFFWMNRGAIAVAQAGIFGIAVRISTILGGLLLAFAPGLGLNQTALLFWALAFYFPLLITETFMVAWLCHRAKF